METSRRNLAGAKARRSGAKGNAQDVPSSMILVLWDVYLDFVDVFFQIVAIHWVSLCYDEPRALRGGSSTIILHLRNMLRHPT